MTKLGVDSAPFRGKLSTLLWQWHTTMAQKITKELEKVELAEAKIKKSSQEKLRAEYGPVLTFTGTRTFLCTHHHHSHSDRE